MSEEDQLTEIKNVEKGFEDPKREEQPFRSLTSVPAVSELPVDRPETVSKGVDVKVVDTYVPVLYSVPNRLVVPVIMDSMDKPLISTLLCLLFLFSLSLCRYGEPTISLCSFSFY